MKRFKLRCGIEVHELTKSDFGLWLRTKADGPRHICTVNPEMAERYSRDADFRQAVGRADICSIDGAGVALAIYRQYGRMVTRLTGVEIVRCIVEVAKQTGQHVAIVGASNQSRIRTEQALRALGVTVHEGSSPTVALDGEMQDGAEDLTIPDDSLVLVALGIPKQEYWIRRRMTQGRERRCTYAGIGGAIDYLSGNAIFAPAFVRWLGFEWLFRLALQPHKRWRRQFATLPRFILREIVAVL